MDKYNCVQAALLSLCAPGNWENCLHVLKPEDVQSFQRLDFNADMLMAIGEGQQAMSWIWLVEGRLGEQL